MPDDLASAAAPTLRASGFVAVARALAGEAASFGSGPVAFQTPPRNPVVDRAIRGRRDGGATVLVRRQGRADARVIEDMVDGVLVAIERTTDRRIRAVPDRAQLLAVAWAAVGQTRPPAPVPVPQRNVPRAA